MHCNIHCVKMILESVQLLYSVWWFYYEQSNCEPIWDDIVPYKKTHINHPCAIWVRHNENHYKWLIDMCEELCKEYNIRYKKVHKSQEHLLHLKKIGYPPIEHCKLPERLHNKLSTHKTPKNCKFFLCAMEDSIFKECAVYKNNSINCVKTYRNYYKYKEKYVFKRRMSWTTIYEPYWFTRSCR
jgi:hypothetical protein